MRMDETSHWGTDAMAIPQSGAIRLLVYSDYKSPFAYLAKNPTLALAVEYRIQVVWMPYTLRIAEYLDPVETRSSHNWRKVRYMYMDARRLASKQGLTIKGPKRLFNGSLSSMGMLFAQRSGFFPTYHDVTFDRFWKRDLDIDSMIEMKQHISNLGGSSQGFERYVLGEGIAEHEQIVSEAERAGVFGVPMFRLDEELFWGGDRLPLVRHAIEKRIALSKS